MGYGFLSMEPLAGVSSAPLTLHPLEQHLTPSRCSLPKEKEPRPELYSGVTSHLFGKQLLSTGCMPGTTLGPGMRQ